jgi:hypothetical protein
MLPDESAAPVDALQRQLRSVVDAQLSAFSVQYAAALDDARRRAREEAERAFAVKVDAIREEWTARLDAELRAARADADRRTEQRVADVRAESERHATNSIALAKLEAERSAAEAVAQARVEAERKASEAIAQARAEAERAADERIALMRVEAERRADDAIGHARAEAERAIAQAIAQARAEAAEEIARAREDAERRIADAIASANLDAEREAAEAIAQARLEADLHVADSLARTREELERTIAAERIRAENAIAGERDRAESALAAREAEAAAARQTVRAVVAAVRALDHSTSLTHALETLTEHAAAVAGRAAVFVLSGDRLSSFRMAGFPSTNGSPYETSLNGAGLLSNAVRTREMQTSNLDVPPPAFAGIAADHVAVAAPLSVGERVVAVVYADAAAGALDVYGAKSHAPASHRDWVDAIDAMARHASLVLGAVTAARTVQAAGVRNGESGAQPAIVDDEQRARRYARLLLSEIKLYHEPAIRAGRQQRDLLQRLRPEIDRARRLYEARVPPAIGPRATYFQQELVQTLADGDAALLGTAV